MISKLDFTLAYVQAVDQIIKNEYAEEMWQTACGVILDYMGYEGYIASAASIFCYKVVGHEIQNKMKDRPDITDVAICLRGLIATSEQAIKDKTIPEMYLTAAKEVMSGV